MTWEDMLKQSVPATVIMSAHSRRVLQSLNESVRLEELNLRCALATVGNILIPNCDLGSDGQARLQKEEQLTQKLADFVQQLNVSFVTALQ